MQYGCLRYKWLYNTFTSLFKGILDAMYTFDREAIKCTFRCTLGSGCISKEAAFYQSKHSCDVHEVVVLPFVCFIQAHSKINCGNSSLITKVLFEWYCCVMGWTWLTMKRKEYFTFQMKTDGCGSINWDTQHYTNFLMHSGYFGYRGAFQTVLDSYCCVMGWTKLTKMCNEYFTFWHYWCNWGVWHHYSRMRGFTRQYYYCKKRYSKLVIRNFQLE